MTSLCLNYGYKKIPTSTKFGKKGNPRLSLQTRFCLGNGNGGVRSDGIGKRDGVIIVDHGSRRKESNLMLSK